MFELIILFIIFYSCYKKIKLESILPKEAIAYQLHSKGFSNIVKVKETMTSTYYSATFHGDTYIFEVMKDNSTVTYQSINTLVHYATRNHFHNIVLLLGTAVIANTAQSAISRTNIQVWDNAKTNSISAKTKKTAASAIIPKMPLDDTCEIAPSEDPIQDGTKVNSLFGNFFGNKIERL